MASQILSSSIDPSSRKAKLSAIFRAFNRARARKTGLDRRRVNRALGLIQRKGGTVRLRIRNGKLFGAIVVGSDGITEYMITHPGKNTASAQQSGWSCACYDSHKNGQVCKHQIAMFAAFRAMQELAQLAQEVTLINSLTLVSLSLGPAMDILTERVSP